MTDIMISGSADIGPPGREAWRMFFRNKAAVGGLIMLIGVIFMTYIGPSSSPRR